MIRTGSPKYMAVCLFPFNGKKWGGGRWLVSIACQFLFWALLVSSQSVSASEYLIGTVTLVNSDQGEFVLMVDPQEEGESQSVTVTSLSSDGEPFLPNCVQLGERIRVWGDFSTSTREVLTAESIRGFGGLMRDRSGVRSRLSRGGDARAGMHRGRNGRGNHN